MKGTVINRRGKSTEKGDMPALVYDRERKEILEFDGWAYCSLLSGFEIRPEHMMVGGEFTGRFEPCRKTVKKQPMAT